VTARRGLRRLGLLGLAAAVSACAAGPGWFGGASPESSRPWPTAAELVAEHRQLAEQLERDGDLHRALDEWNIALTIAPGDGNARQRKKALEARIEETVATRLRQGRDALSRGAHLEARRHFLAVLVADPANRLAFEALRSEVKEVRFIVHTVRRGESLATLADRYYGDRSRSEVIAESNQMPPNARVGAGMVVKIPEIPGLPFAVPELRPPTVVETPEMNPLLAESREALERGDFAVALADVELVLGSNPQSSEALELKKAILYSLGRTQLEQGKLRESYQTLTQLTRLVPSYQDAPAMLRQARERLVQQYYNQGLRLYREEKLEEAIAAWRAALELDPEHANARRNLEQAERVLRGLEQRRRATPPAPAK
jgi:tetratricopeptide (TPR) repeat protein